MKKEVLGELKNTIIKFAESNKLTYAGLFVVLNTISNKHGLSDDLYDCAFSIINDLGIELEEDVVDSPQFLLKVDEDGYSQDIVATYFKTMSRVPLLSEETELDLAIKISECTDEKEKKALKEKFIKHNLRLVISVAKKYTSSSTAAMDFMDLIQEGNLGLQKAVDKYDYRKGYKFSTYAIWWIRQGITRYIADTSKTIRIPVHAFDRVKKMNKILFEESMKNEKISDEELAKKLDVSVELVKVYRQVAGEPTSLQAPVGEEEDTDLGSFIADETFSISEELEKKDLHDSLMKSLGILNERERKVVLLRYGMYDGRVYTLEEIAQMPEFKLTRERIRQIENKALNKIKKNPKILQGLSVYLEKDPFESGMRVR